MMTKKHYEAIAAIIKDTRINWYHDRTAINLADYFEQDNPKFNRSRFLEACGIKLCECEGCPEPVVTGFNGKKLKTCFNHSFNHRKSKTSRAATPRA